MDKREKVIKGLELCHNECLEPSNGKCPYYPETQGDRCFHVLLSDALALLKAQEPVKPKWEKGYAYCGQCGYKLHWIVERNNFCPNCGQAVKWE